MKKVLLAAVLTLTAFAGAGEEAFLVQFAKPVMGKTVKIAINGTVEMTFAGKLLFRDAATSRLTVCGDVSAPVSNGQYGYVRKIDSASYLGNRAKAGNIVAKYFNDAKTPDQCAGLQLAVWEAIEDGGATPDFQNGNFQAQADPAVIAFAQKFYDAVNTKGHADFFEATAGKGFQSQIGAGPM